MPVDGQPAAGAAVTHRGIAQSATAEELFDSERVHGEHQAGVATPPQALLATENGIPVIPPNAHIALARHRTDDEKFLRRPYNFDDPPARGATSNSGLIFAAYQRDPAKQFIPVQQRLAEADTLNPWITTIGSATFAVLPGVAEGGFLGQTLLV